MCARFDNVDPAGKDNREPVVITSDKKIGDMVFSKGDEWLVSPELKDILKQNGVI
ncbi:MAG: hypothetical protein WC279_14885 [Sulfurimonas sp.]|jgi:predicted RNA-binding protein with PIN domain|uniref:hypothetical protein n=1 Tax=Sulfurimonas sp. TaxID=2022749 RepID=UPI00356B38DB